MTWEVGKYLVFCQRGEGGEGERGGERSETVREDGLTGLMSMKSRVERKGHGATPVLDKHKATQTD